MGKAVLIDVVDFAEPDEGHEPLARLESVVRLRFLDCCLRDLIERSNAPARLLEAARFTADGEGEMLISIERVLPSLSDGEGVDDVIEGAPKVVHGVSEQHGPWPADRHRPTRRLLDRTRRGVRLRERA